MLNCGENMKKSDPFYKSAKWKKKRETILRRDGYSCQMSKRYGKQLAADTVHHIYPRGEYPQYAFCDWNLISLSRKWHNALHNRENDSLTVLGEKLKQTITPPIL